MIAFPDHQAAHHVHPIPLALDARQPAVHRLGAQAFDTRPSTPENVRVVAQLPPPRLNEWPPVVGQRPALLQELHQRVLVVVRHVWQPPTRAAVRVLVDVQEAVPDVVRIVPALAHVRLFCAELRAHVFARGQDVRVRDGVCDEQRLRDVARAVGDEHGQADERERRRRVRGREREYVLVQREEVAEVCRQRGRAVRT